VWANFNTGAGNTIMGPDYKLLHGQADAWQQFGACDMLLGPGTFVQVGGRGGMRLAGWRQRAAAARRAPSALAPPLLAPTPARGA
jgi:hypothetical protein